MKENKKHWWRDYGVGQKTLDIMENSVGHDMIVFDTETTGLSPEKDRVIQLSAIKFHIEEDYQLNEIDRFDTYINPGYPLSKVIVKLTGITDEKLSHYPNEKDQWDKIHEFFGDNPIVCGHNSPFDIGMMNAMYLRNVHHLFVEDGLDTLRMAQELHLKSEAGSHKLGVLAEHFGLDYGLTFHNSMDDVTATVRLLRFFVDEYIEKRKLGDPPAGQKAKLINCWPWNGAQVHRPDMQRLYVKVRIDSEPHILWFNQRRQHEWGDGKNEKGLVDMIDMKDLEEQVLALYGCKDLDELGQVREARYANR